MSPTAAVRAALRERPVLANSTAVVALRAANLGARLLLLFTIAHQVAPASFGLLVFAMSVAEIGKVVADFGMDTLAIREYAMERAPGAHAGFAAGLAAAKLVLGLVVVAGLAAWFAFTASPEQAQLGFILSASALTSLFVNFSIDWFQGRLRVARVLVPVLALNGALALTGVLVLPHLHDLRVQALAFPLIETATGLVLLVRLRGEGLLAKPHFAFERVAPLVVASLPIALTAIVIMTYSRLDVLMLAKKLDAAAVGQYGMAFRLTEPFQIAAAAFGLSVFSRFSAWFGAASPAPLRPQVLRYVGATLAYGLAAAFALGVVAPLVVVRWFPAYAPGVPVLRILSGVLVVRSLNATLAGILQGAGRFRWLTALAMWNLLFFFVLLTVLIDRQGATGAALAGLVGEGVNSLLMLALVSLVVGRHERRVADGR